VIRVTRKPTKRGIVEEIRLTGRHADRYLDSMLAGGAPAEPAETMAVGEFMSADLTRARWQPGWYCYVDASSPKQSEPRWWTSPDCVDDGEWWCCLGLDRDHPDIVVEVPHGVLADLGHVGPLGSEPGEA
jgi:hypothetical protein